MIQHIITGSALLFCFGLIAGVPISGYLGWYRLQDALIWFWVVMMFLVQPAVFLIRLSLLVLRGLLWLAVAAIERLQREAFRDNHPLVPSR